MKIYVGNLNYQTTVDGLKDAFAKFGAVEEVNIINGRGFGFVTMGDDDGRKAIEALNNTPLDGRTIKVSEARPREARPRRDYDRGGFGGNRY